jgi:hypothetical protein
MRILDEIASGWGWKGVRPCAIIMQNAFGNVIFTDDEGRYWRICPEDLSCDVIAADSERFERVRESESFVTDWGMQALVDQARAAIGTPTAGECYCLKIPSVLGGAYVIQNIGTIDRAELIAASGHIAEQIKDLPDGAKIRLRVTD